MKRLMAAVLATVGAVALVVLPAGSASAHPSYHSIGVWGHMNITDADWPDGDDHNYVEFSGGASVSEATPTASLRFEGCSDEVRVVLDVTIVHQPNQPWVTVNTRTRLYEGASCATTDKERDVRRTYYVGSERLQDSWTVWSGGNMGSTMLNVSHSHG
ncbi:MAG TPA: hypothetical protein VK453_18580 [Micromonosporaceae bacterium]|nr:hypothetical protein [Micromonosporaceae bacterium]